jgi:hypothetical protein
MVCSKVSISIVIAHGLQPKQVRQINRFDWSIIPSPKSVSARYWMVLGMVVHMHMVSSVIFVLMDTHWQHRYSPCPEPLVYWCQLVLVSFCPPTYCTPSQPHFPSSPSHLLHPTVSVPHTLIRRFSRLSQWNTNPQQQGRNSGKLQLLALLLCPIQHSFAITNRRNTGKRHWRTFGEHSWRNPPCLPWCQSYQNPWDRIANRSWWVLKRQRRRGSALV